MPPTVDLTEDDTPWSVLADLFSEIESPGEQALSSRSSSHKAVLDRFLTRFVLYQACLHVGLKMHQQFTRGWKWKV